jgi:uncharacterized peroxidase-related enzyme
MFLLQPPDTAATERLYQSDRDTAGYVMNLSRAWAWRPDIAEAFSALRRGLTSQASFRFRETAVIVCATAASRGDAYCALAWGSRLAAVADPATAVAVLTSAICDRLSARERALARWVRMLVEDPNATRASDVAELRAAGLSDQDIFDATALAAFRLAFSTINATLGVAPDVQIARAAPAPVRRAVRFGRPCADVAA